VSSITVTSTTRPAPGFDTWRQLGNRGWVIGCAAVFQTAGAARRRGEDKFAAGRQLTVTTMDWQDRSARLHGRCDEPGIPATPITTGHPGGVSYASAHQNGLRVSAARHSCVRDAAAELHVRTHAHATSITSKASGDGVRYSKGEGRRRRRGARGQGSHPGRRHYNSPQLLQLSGVGSPDSVELARIEVRHALPGRQGLQDHYAPRSVAALRHQDHQ